MQKTTLVVMAAGMGSRYGGLKQIDPLGPNGEIILDYSVFDAAEAGFDRVVFVIKREIEEDFRRITDGRYDGKIQVDYAFQSITELPEGFSVPENRVKPWGTGQAVLSCKGLIDGPFAVINADDYYGRETLRLVHDELLKNNAEKNGRYSFCMAGFKLENTLTENGTVARGVCQTDADGFLTFVVDELLKEGKAEVKVLETTEKWYGVTYQEDRDFVAQALSGKIKEGIYPEKLW